MSRKSLGQVAYEWHEEFVTNHYSMFNDWEDLSEDEQKEWETVAHAIVRHYRALEGMGFEPII